MNIYPEFDICIPREGDKWIHRGDGFFSRGIKIKQIEAGFTPLEAEVTHVEVSCGEELSVRVWPFEKIQMIDIRDKYAGKFLELVRSKKMTDDRKAARVAMWAVSNSNKRYDFSGIGAFLSKLIRQNASRLFCSENAIFSDWKEYPDMFKDHKIKIEKEGDCYPAHYNPCTDPDHEYFTVWKGYIPRKRIWLPVQGSLSVTF